MVAIWNIDKKTITQAGPKPPRQVTIGRAVFYHKAFLLSNDNPTKSYAAHFEKPPGAPVIAQEKT